MADWISEADGFYSAIVSSDMAPALHVVVESLGEMGWDWQVWDPAGRVQQRYGLADTLEEAKARAEHTLHEMQQQLGSGTPESA